MKSRRTAALVGPVVTAGLVALVCVAAACGDDRPRAVTGEMDGGPPLPDGCAARPCQNGGACSPAPGGGFSCACAAGFAGVTCASDIDDCLPNPCRNGGTCVDGVARATCVCRPALTGDRCELPRFRALGATPCGGSAVATAVSADGSTVVGTCGSHAALLWTEAGGTVDLGILSATAIDAIPIAVNADGSAFLSRFRRAGGTSGVLRWDAGGGTTDVLLQPSGTVLFANAASRDLGVLVGAYLDQTLLPGFQLGFRHTQGAGFEALEAPALSSAGCGAFAVSADGSVVAGTCYDPGGVTRAARWRARGAAMPLDLLEASGGSYANAVSGDGRVIVGYALLAGNVAHASRFEGEGPMEDLGALPDADVSTAYATSFDGSVVAGLAEHASFPFVDYAMVWDRPHGMRSIAAVLAAAGVDTSGWFLPSATTVSDDGKVIVGNGTAPDGIGRFWLARLP